MQFEQAKEIWTNPYHDLARVERQSQRQAKRNERKPLLEKQMKVIKMQKMLVNQAKVLVVMMLAEVAAVKIV